MIKLKVKRRSQKQERSVAKTLVAKTVVASGSLWGSKGDVRNDKFLIECKTTEKTYYSVKNTIWEKIKEEATKDNLRIPLLIVDLEDKHRFVVFDINSMDNCLPCIRVIDNSRSNSFRITEEIMSTFDPLGRPIYYVYKIKSNTSRLGTPHTLGVVPIKDFMTIFKEELQ